ncbi:dihydrofolate reductase family protein [Thermoactinospora rubra]|uniref:dihydrofolate reductase family protein n=1 Tax=Thermoactinospora rubra TaxID=1088767 RepID=UPI000A1200CC|nr:dihydrofolate reductase family protein [Thermoactinospora rubra]
MARIVVTESISLDGVAEAPGGEGFKYRNWSFEFDRGAEGEAFKVDEALGAEALLIGRRTYESFAGAWPHQEGRLADKYNSMPKYVISSTLTDPAWANTRVLGGEVIEEVRGLKRALEGEIQVPGSIRLVQELLGADLVDEIRLMTFPVILGTGRRLFGQTADKTRWKLTRATTVGEGILITIFQRAGR